MSSLAIDYSFARPSPAAIRAAGYAAVIRYLSGVPGKDLTAAEAASLHAAGLGIGLIWETTATRALDGAAAGTVDGQLAGAEALKVGLPRGCLLLVNVGDFAATEQQLGVIEAYYHAWRQETEGTWQTGGYATAFIIAGLIARGAQGIWWQNAMDDQGVSGSVVSPHASLYQRTVPTRPRIAGSSPGDYDENAYGFGPAAPAWWMPAPAAPPAPAPAVTLAEARAAAATITAYLGAA